MQALGRQIERPELKEIVLEASRALAHLDADRLDELAASCRMLNRAQMAANPADRAKLALETQATAQEMQVFGHMLQATRANMRVLRRLRELRAGHVEYAPPALHD